jgi:hypothetical protein
MRSYILSRKSNLATDAGNGLRGLSLANAALLDRARLTPRQRAVALRQRGLATALLREETTCAAALDGALSELSASSGGGVPDSLEYCTSSYVLMEAGRCWLLLGHSSRAVAALEEALAGWIDPFTRDRGIALSRLAHASLAGREVERACAVAREAAEVARSTASARITAELRDLRLRLAPYRKVGVVSEVRSELDRLA